VTIAARNLKPFWPRYGPSNDRLGAHLPPLAQIRYTQPVIARSRSRKRSVAGGDEAISLKTLQKP
jgi:hypothetical protein